MTATLEAPVSTPFASYGDRAFAIIDKHSHDAGERFSVEPLRYEFHSLAHELGHSGLWLADAANNLAGAFKWQGALFAASLLQEQGHNSVVAASAGNHLRGLIVAAGILNMEVDGFVPRNAPPQKKQGAQELAGRLGVNLRLHVTGDTFSQTLAASQSFSKHHDRPFIHPFDDPAVMAGQGALADKILHELPTTKNVIIPTGGAGILPAIAARLHELDKSDIAVYGVQAEGSDSLSRSLGHDKPVAATSPNQRFGGSAVEMVGRYGLAICNKLINPSNIITVSDHEVNAVIDQYHEDYETYGIDMNIHTPFEPTTQVALAGLRQINSHLHGDTVVLGTGRNAPLFPTPVAHLPRSRVSSGQFLR